MFNSRAVRCYIRTVALSELSHCASPSGTYTSLGQERFQSSKGCRTDLEPDGAYMAVTLSGYKPLDVFIRGLYAKPRLVYCANKLFMHMVEPLADLFLGTVACEMCGRLPSFSRNVDVMIAPRFKVYYILKYS